MTRAPMGLSSEVLAKNGYGRAKSPRQEASYPDIVFSQFTGAEMMAEKHGFSKDEMDAFGFDSQRKAIAATQGRPVRQGSHADRGGRPRRRARAPHRRRGHPLRCHARRASRAVRLIKEGGRISAATASQICDGASGVMVVNERGLKALGVAPLARIHAMTMSAGDPVLMLEEPLFATDKALKRAGMKIDDIDLYEVNEAFAPVPMAWLKHTGADPARLNVHGGAIALGHPLGASGTKLMTTLVHALKARGKRYGLQTMCEGGGMANVTIVERL